MGTISNYLPKDLVNIVEEYVQDPEYDKVVKQLHIMFDPLTYRKIIVYERQRINLRTYAALNRFGLRNDCSTHVFIGNYQVFDPAINLF